MSFLLGTRVNGRPSALEQAAVEKAKRPKATDATQVYDGPAQRDHTDDAETAESEREGFDDAPAEDGGDAPDRHRIKPPATKGRNPIADAIERHNAHTPTSTSAGRELVNPPTSRDRAPLNPTGGTAAPGAPVLADARGDASGTPDSLSTHAEAAREGVTRAQTRAPSGLDFTSSGAGIHAAARHPDGSFVGQGDVPHATLDLTRQGAPAAHFTRPNEALPGHAMNGPSTGQPNVNTNERTDQ